MRDHLREHATPHSSVTQAFDRASDASAGFARTACGREQIEHAVLQLRVRQPGGLGRTILEHARGVDAVGRHTGARGGELDLQLAIGFASGPRRASGPASPPHAHEGYCHRRSCSASQLDTRGVSISSSYACVVTWRRHCNPGQASCTWRYAASAAAAMAAAGCHQRKMQATGRIIRL